MNIYVIYKKPAIKTNINISFIKFDMFHINDLKSSM